MIIMILEMIETVKVYDDESTLLTPNKRKDPSSTVEN